MQYAHPHSFPSLIPPLLSELNKDVTEQELDKMFMAFGTVTVVKIPRDAATRVSLGYAYVDFLDTASGAWRMILMCDRGEEALFLSSLFSTILNTTLVFPF